VSQTCPADNLVYTFGMSKIAILILLALVLVGTGCKTRPGSREFIPGKGWVPN